MTDSRLTREIALAAVGKGVSDTRLTREIALAAVGGNVSDTRLTRLVVLVAMADPPKPGVIHGHRTPLSLGRR